MSSGRGSVTSFGGGWSLFPKTWETCFGAVARFWCRSILENSFVGSCSTVIGEEEGLPQALNGKQFLSLVQLVKVHGMVVSVQEEFVVQHGCMFTPNFEACEHLVD